MSTHVPTLSEAGWIGGTAEKLDTLLSYFYLSEHSQSNTYKGRIASLPYIIQQFGDDELRLKQAAQDVLTKFIGAYFDEINVNITTDKPLPDDPSRIDLQIDIVVIDDGVSYSAGAMVQTIQGKLVKIFKLNNEIGQSQ